MDKQQAAETLAGMVDADQAPVLALTDLGACLDLSVLPDKAGRLPDHPGWEPTWDLDWAAAETSVLRHLRSQPQLAGGLVTKIESEGSSFGFQPSTVDWLDTARVWRERSQIGRQLGYGRPTGMIEIPVSPVFRPGTDAFR